MSFGRRFQHPECKWKMQQSNQIVKASLLYRVLWVYNLSFQV